MPILPFLWKYQPCQCKLVITDILPWMYISVLFFAAWITRWPAVFRLGITSIGQINVKGKKVRCIDLRLTSETVSIEISNGKASLLLLPMGYMSTCVSIKKKKHLARSTQYKSGKKKKQLATCCLSRYSIMLLSWEDRWASVYASLSSHLWDDVSGRSSSRKSFPRFLRLTHVELP